MDTNEKKLTDTQIDEIATAASEVEGADKMLVLKDEVKIDEEATLEAAPVEDEIDMIAKQVENYEMDLFDTMDPEKYEEAKQEKLVNSIKASMKANEKGEDITDEEAFAFIQLATTYKNDPSLDVYKALPKKFQDTIDKLMLEAGIGVSNRNAVSRMILGEFMNTAEVNAVFVDFEKALNEALNMPSIVDLYTEHTRDTMEKNIPEMIEKIKDKHPEKAEMLAQVKNAFTEAYTLERLKNLYSIENNHVFKAVRRNDTEYKRHLDAFNRINVDSKFKMYDVRDLPVVLEKVLIKDPAEQINYYIGTGMEVPELVQRLVDMAITKIDIEKFSILLTHTALGMDGNNVIHAAYMYYLTKNIIMLKHTQEAKTAFAAELINNICDIIALIRDKEAVFYAQNPHLVKSKSAKKSRSAHSGKK